MLLNPEHREYVLAGGSLAESFTQSLSTELDVELAEIQFGLQHLKAVTDKDIDTLLTLQTLQSKDTHLVSELVTLEKIQQHFQWHNECVIIPQANAMLIRAKMEQGYSYQQAKNWPFDTNDLELAIEKIKQEGKYFFPRPTYPEGLGEISCADTPKYAVLSQKFEENLKTEKLGMNKTQLLKSIGKDNGSWRSIAQNVLDYLELMQRVRQIDNVYYHMDHAPPIYETAFHRRVYESLGHGPLTITSIVQQVGYDNASGRKKVRKILTLLSNEGLIDQQGQRWTLA